MTLEEFLSRVDGSVIRTRRGVLVRCPGHDDRAPSLSISEAGGRILLKDFAGCSAERITAALGLRLRDLFADDQPQPRSPRPRRRSVAEEVIGDGQRKQARIEPYRKGFMLADRVREDRQVVEMLRREASALGDTDRGWDLLYVASEIEQEANLAEAESEQALRDASEATRRR